MPKEVLLDIISKKLFFQLAVIIAVYILHHLIFLELGLRFDAKTLKFDKHTITAILCFGIYALIGKQFLPIPVFGVGSVIVFAWALWLSGFDSSQSIINN